MKKFLRTVILLVCVFICGEANAGHNSGCDIQYSYRSKDSIDLTVTMYRNCKNVSMSAIRIDVEGIGCNYSTSYNVQSSSCSDITPVCKSSCSKCDKSNCNAYGYPNGSYAGCNFPYGIEKVIYLKTIDLTSTNCCKLRFSIYTSARDGAITTCCASESIYNYAEIDRCNAPQNVSPLLSINPTQIMCVGNCMGINLGGIDTVDYDSISYHLSSPLNGYGSPCTYVGQYSYSTPLYYDSFPKKVKFNGLKCTGFSLDPYTGILNFKPMQQQVAVIAIDIKEWRKDTANIMKQIGLTRRDIELIIITGSGNKSPSLPTNNISACAGDLVCMSGIQSSDPDKKDTVILQYYGNLSGAKFTPKFNGSSKQEFDFCWQTSSTDASAMPYYFMVTATDDACPINGSFSRIYNIKLDYARPSAEHKVTYLGCNKLKLESPNSNASSKDTFTYTWTVNGNKYSAKDTVVEYIYDSMVVVRLEVKNKICVATYYDTIYNLPKDLKLDLGSDTSVCQGSTVVIRANASDGFPPYKYLWNTGNANDTLDFHLATINNTTKLYCKVTDSSGCEKNVAVNINIFAPLNFSVGPDQSKCLGDTFTLDAGKSSTSYQWIDANTHIILSKTQYLQTNISGNYIINAMDTNGCSASDSISTHILTPKPVQVSDQRKCEGETIVFDAGANYMSYVWRDLASNNIISKTRTLSVSFNNKFIVYTTDSNSCIASDTLEAFFNPKVMFTTQFANKLCEHDTIKIISSGADYVEWRNLLDTTLLYKGNTFYHRFDSSTQLVLKGFTTIGGVTCSASDTISINLSPLPQITISPRYIACPGDMVTITATGQQYAYIWNTGDTGKTIYTNSPGKYTITATDVYGCKVSKETQLFNFPQPTVSLTFLNDTLYANSNPPSKDYNWYLDNQYYSYSKYPWQHITKLGSYLVKITDTNGCIATSQLYKVSSLSILDLSNSNDFKIYPNPSTGIYNIESTEKIFDITIYDLMGRKVYYNTSNNYNTIDLSGQPEGIYLLQINKNVWVRLSKL